MRRDRKAEAAIREGAHPDVVSRAAAVQLELEIPEERPARQLTFPEFLGEGIRRSRLLGIAEEAVRVNPCQETHRAFSRAAVAFDEYVGEYIGGYRWQTTF